MKRLDRFVEQSEVNMFAKLFEAGDARRLAIYLEEMLKPIDVNAPKQKDQLKRTLLCYFDCQHNIKLAATTLGVHVNTMRQRLETLREITGTPFAGGDAVIATFQCPSVDLPKTIPDSGYFYGGNDQLWNTGYGVSHYKASRRLLRSRNVPPKGGIACPQHL